MSEFTMEDDTDMKIKENEPTKVVELTTISVTDRSYARSAPRMIAAHF
jgi:hypothetical protein